jgi:hypothetical protein
LAAVLTIDASAVHPGIEDDGEDAISLLLFLIWIAYISYLPMEEIITRYISIKKIFRRILQEILEN